MQRKPQEGQPAAEVRQLPKETLKEKEVKKEKPKDDWKAAAEAKKLKKEQDRQKDKEKLEKKQQQEKPAATKPSKEQKPGKPPQEPPTKNQQPKESKAVEAPKQVEQAPPKLAAVASEQIQPLSTIEQLLPRRLRSLKKIQPDEDALRNVLLQHTSKYFHEHDSVLVASQHAICRQWFEKQVCEVVDIWDISSTSTRKENIIRTRFQDVSHLLHTTTKIVCGATAIFQNGVVLSEPGTLLLALLAHQHRIPFIIFCETYRYCDASLLEGDLSENEGILYDLINPKYISMLITEAGPITVCSIPTLVSALYGIGLI